MTMLAAGAAPAAASPAHLATTAQLATWSSRGRTQDGNEKPDVIAPGAKLVSTSTVVGAEVASNMEIGNPTTDPANVGLVPNELIDPATGDIDYARASWTRASWTRASWSTFSSVFSPLGTVGA